MTAAATSRRSASFTPGEAKLVFSEDTKNLLATLRGLLELSQLTDEQQGQVNDITNSLFAGRRQAGES